MTQQIAGATSSRIGTCPHGLPIGACPICNGGGGGGAKKMQNSKPSNEMTWSQCFAQGMLMKQTQARAEAKMDSPLYNAQVFQKVQQAINNFVTNTQQMISALKNSLPQPLANVVNVLNQVIITPLLNIISKIPQLIQSIQNLTQNIRNVIQQVSEKLTAFFGEVKNFVNKKVSDFVKSAKKKLFGFLNLTGMDDEEEEENAKSFLEVFTSKKN